MLLPWFDAHVTVFTYVSETEFSYLLLLLISSWISITWKFTNSVLLFIILYCTIYHFSFSSLCYPIPIAPVSSHAPCVCLLQSHLFPPLPPFPTLGITNLFGLYTLSYREKELEFSLKINILRIFGTFVCTDHLFPMLLNNILDIDDNLFKYSLIGRLVSSFHFLLWWLELPWIFT